MQMEIASLLFLTVPKHLFNCGFSC